MIRQRLHDGDLLPGATDHEENRGADHWHDGSDDPSHEPSMTHSCESSRAGGVPGSPGVSTPG